MRWEKSRLIYIPEIHNKEGFTHAAIPFVIKLSENKFRIFFSSRNPIGLSFPFYADFNFEGTFELIGISEELMSLGELGTFDDRGIMPSCLTAFHDKLFLYYIGWNPQVSVSYRLSIGLSISGDGGQTFERYSKGPIMDRSLNEPYFNTAPCVLYENGLWKMWYISCTGWKTIKNYPEPQYHVKFASSKDGIYWDKKDIVCLDYNEKMEAIGRPSVIKLFEIYLMFFSYRKLEDYRTNPQQSYKIGLAVSKDGLNWEITHTPLLNMEVLSEWDNQMQEYCCPTIIKDNLYIFYNGNGFGKSGIGYTSVHLKDFREELSTLIH